VPVDLRSARGRPRCDAEMPRPAYKLSYVSDDDTDINRAGVMDQRFCGHRADTARSLFAPPSLSQVTPQPRCTMAATNKCLAQRNKSRTGMPAKLSVKRLISLRNSGHVS
jgi:hypothetical protein